MPKVDGATNSFDSKENINLNTQRASGMPEILNNGGSLPVTTTNIEVYANGQKVGFVQNFSPSENRTITKVKELGTEGVVQSVPSNTLGGQLTVSRLTVYNANLYNALGLTPTGKFVQRDSQTTADGPATSLDKDYNTYGNPFKTLKDQRVPLEFMVKTRMPSTSITDTKYVIETYIDCWLASYSKTIAANTITITENATVQYSDVISTYA